MDSIYKTGIWNQSQYVLFLLFSFSSTEEESLDMPDVMSCLCFFEMCLFCLHTLLPFLLLCFFLLRNESNQRKHFFTLNELVGEWTMNCFDNRQREWNEKMCIWLVEWNYFKYIYILVERPKRNWHTEEHNCKHK